MKAMNLLETSPFRDPTQVPLPDNHPIQAQIKGRLAVGEEEEEEDGEDSHNKRELAEQIDSHIMVVDLDNPTASIALGGTDTSEIALAPTTPSSGDASLVLPDAT